MIFVKGIYSNFLIIEENIMKIQSKDYFSNNMYNNKRFFNYYKDSFFITKIEG